MVISSISTPSSSSARTFIVARVLFVLGVTSTAVMPQPR